MRATDDLFRLIQSLNKAEKRYFKLFASRYDSGRKNNYILLFDAIEKQSYYDEDDLKKQFEGETFIRHLPSEKNYLYNLILDSLHLFHVENSEEQKIRKRLHHAGILIERGLSHQAEKLLRQAKKAAVEKELFQLALEIINLEKGILSRNYYTGSSEEELNALYDEENDYLQKVKEGNDYWKLFSSFYYFHYSKGSSRNARQWQKIEEIMADPLLSDISRANSFQAKLDFYHIHSLYQFMQGNPAMAAEYNKAYLELLESKPERLKSYAKRYMAILNNYLMDCLGLKQYEEVLKGIEKLRSLPENHIFYNNRNTEADIFRLSSILELNLYIKSGEFGKGLQKVDYIKSALDTFDEQVVIHNKLTIFYLLAYIYFGAGKYSDALRWLNRIINEGELQVLQDIQAFARIFSLIVHFELDNYEILDYLQASTYRYLSKKDTFYKAENILMRYLKRLSGLSDKKELQKVFIKLRQELLPLSEDPLEKKAFEYFDFISWLEGKISGRSFGEVLKEREGVEVKLN